MSESLIRILLIEDNPGDAKLIEEFLIGKKRTLAGVERFDLVHEVKLADGLKRLSEKDFDIILLDLNLPDSKGMDTFAKLHVEAPDTPTVVLTGMDDEALAVQTLQVGAQDYLVKGMLDWGLLARAVHYAIERQRATQDLREYAQKLWASESRFRKIIESSSDGMIILTNDFRILFLNPAAEKLLEIRQEQAQGNLFGYPVHPGETSEIQIPRERSNPRIVEMHIVGIEWEGQKAYLASMHDITDRKRAEVALRESEERFRSVAETAADAIVLAKSNFGILYWNQTAVDMFGYEKWEVQDKPLTILLPENHVSELIEAISELRSEQGGNILGKPLKLDGIRKDNSEFPLELSLATWVSNEERFYSIILRDMSEAYESQRRTQIQDRLAAVGQLAAGIAHDFNNILGTIILYSESLLMTLELSEEDHERMSMIFDQARRGAMVTAQILDFSRKSVMEPRPIDLHSFFVKFKKLLSRMLSASIQIDIEAENGKFITNADPTRLQQVFMNLSLNARDALPDGGKLRFILSKTDIKEDDPAPFDEMQPGEWIRISVSDSGVGVSPENIEHLFEPFFTTKKPGKGTGLGLAQVYGIIKQHGGFIKVDSELGVGTTFTIYLQVETEGEVVELDLEAESATEGSKEVVLIVEDDLSTRRVFHDILTSLKYHVLVAGDGHEAVEIFDQKNGEIDLVISDMVMPEMDGRELYELLSGEYPDTKIILITGYPLSDGTRRLLDHRKAAWLQKPITMGTLARAVRDMLDRGSVEAVKQTDRLEG
jgi:PAS domain S-box-containing protein